LQKGAESENDEASKRDRGESEPNCTDLGGVQPFGGRHAIKMSYSTGVVTESGGDFDVFLLNYQVIF